ncbi:MAG: polyphosphate kinase 1 [Candidatus Thermoplasmatota archaeon]
MNRDSLKMNEDPELGLIQKKFIPIDELEDQLEQRSVQDNVLDDPALYINRELSWLRLNERIFEEACDKTHPLLERAKFLAICGSNIDEFFMVRVSGLKRQLSRGALKVPLDGMTTTEQLKTIRKEVLQLFERYEGCWNEIVSDLEKEGIYIKKVQKLSKKQKTALKKYFEQMIFPTLTPLALDFSHPFPFLSNLSLNLAVVILDAKNQERYARVKIPSDLFPRFVPVPSEQNEEKNQLHNEQEVIPLEYVLLEDLIATNLEVLFPGLDIVGAYSFRVIRDAEISISMDQAADLLTAIEESIETRKVGSPVCLMVDGSMPQQLQDLFMKNLGLSHDFVYQVNRPLGLVDLWQLLRIDRPALKDTPFLPFTPPELREDRNILDALTKKDFVLYHPYDSFNIFINFLKQAANDRNVLAIKITMYRIAKKSPIIDVLMEARQNGKDVTVLVELKAKFDEENNINWARSLEQAGVHVVYGLVDLKVHAKICLVVKKEGDKIIRFCHIGTGNYNEITARVYGDLGYFTCNPAVGADLSDLFNSLTGYSSKDEYSTLIVAPKMIRREMIRRIEREIEIHKKEGNGYIALKMNGLVDAEIIKALYRASMAGVKIDLNVRGLCCLRPGIKDISENITEISIIGRFLEHARMYYFRNGGNDELIIGSADMMPRNLDRRVEVLFPVPDPRLRKAILTHMLQIHLKDTVKARRLLPDGVYVRVHPTDDKEMLNSQQWLLDHRGIWHERE